MSLPNKLAWTVATQDWGGSMSGRGSRKLARAICSLGGPHRLTIYVGNDRLPVATTVGRFLDRCDPQFRKDFLPVLVEEQKRHARKSATLENKKEKEKK